MVRRGELTGGHSELMHGLRRVEQLEARGVVGPSRAERYRMELLADCERWGALEERA